MRPIHFLSISLTLFSIFSHSQPGRILNLDQPSIWRTWLFAKNEFPAMLIANMLEDNRNNPDNLKYLVTSQPDDVPQVEYNKFIEISNEAGFITFDVFGEKIKKAFPFFDSDMVNIYMKENYKQYPKEIADIVKSNLNAYSLNNFYFDADTRCTKPVNQLLEEKKILAESSRKKFIPALFHFQRNGYPFMNRLEKKGAMSCIKFSHRLYNDAFYNGSRSIKKNSIWDNRYPHDSYFYMVGCLFDELKSNPEKDVNAFCDTDLISCGIRQETYSEKESKYYKRQLNPEDWTTYCNDKKQIPWTEDEYGMCHFHQPEQLLGL
jgi:hypothetical protein